MISINIITACPPYTAVKLSTISDWAFLIAAAHIWNAQPRHVMSATSLPVFCSHLDTPLQVFISFPWVLLSDLVIIGTSHTYLQHYIFHRPVTLPVLHHSTLIASTRWTVDNVSSLITTPPPTTPPQDYCSNVSRELSQIATGISFHLADIVAVFISHNQSCCLNSNNSVKCRNKVFVKCQSCAMLTPHL